MTERSGVITFQGGPLTLIGDEVKVGDAAPDAEVLANDLSPVTLSSLRGKVVVLCCVPSLDTPVCDIETRRFNQAAAALGENVAIVAASMDLPFAQQRWCAGAGVDAVQTVSDHRDAALGQAYGVLIKELRLLSRAVFVIDAEGIVRHAEYVKEITTEPDYDAALEAARKLT